jgi:DNA-binding NarL/FixJ family response regulator
MRVAPDRPIRVLIVDDHVAIRVGLKSMLEAQGGIEVMGVAASGFDALACLLRAFRTSSWSIFECTV